MTRKRVVVTGGSGRVGRHVIKAMAADHDVINADLAPPRDGHDHGARFIQTDVMDLDSVRAALKGADAVVHLAGLDYDWGCEPERYIDVNARGSWHVLQAAEEQGLGKVVLCSSISICGLQEMRPDWAPQSLPIDERHENRPVYPYGVSKQVAEVMGESFARKGKLEVICLRPLAVILPETLGQYLDFVDAPDRHWLFYYITAEDLARAFKAAVEVSGISFDSFYIGADDTSHSEATLDWYRRIVGPLPADVDAERYRTNPRAAVFGNDRAKARLGWAPTSNFDAMRAAHESARVLEAAQ
ncbi:NAD-dependent epimerase/dehydratase family protein [Paracoccus jeotgali]|uniref:NAD(P)-dependent oxidoreductase n=1 Tax=Paracoccus jeotgali TaxID=2065379 RepID=A0A2K9MHL2_9RHOB|nr:NAD(P)-dependent oxidoreductase [Paracoccus jeotgali]AUM75121.1 NAD(P)-dependent oxidoreductase [Paracoccus jeotgali]